MQGVCWLDFLAARKFRVQLVLRQERREKKCKTLSTWCGGPRDGIRAVTLGAGWEGRRDGRCICTLHADETRRRDLALSPCGRTMLAAWEVFGTRGAGWLIRAGRVRT